MRDAIAMTAGKVIDGVALSIVRDDVLHFLGYPVGQQPPDRIERLLDEAISEARRLVSARGAWVRLPIRRAAELTLEPIAAAELVIGLVTIGAEVERRASEFLEKGETTRALLLDAAGSAAAEEAADRLSAAIVGESDAASIADRPAHVSCRISPGYGGWPITAQKSLFEILPHGAIGVALLPSMLMVPRKSISFAMWIGADARPVAGLSGCVRCELEQCRYRRVE